MIRIILEQDENQIESENLAKCHNQLDESILKDMEKVLRLILERESVGSETGDIDVSLSIVDENQIRELNRDYRQTDKVTDVLSFPQFETKNELLDFQKNNKGMPLELGDVVICYHVAQKQATEYGHSEERELVYLFVHSILHLLGYDHMEEDDKSQMRAREKEIMKEIDLPK